MAVGECMSFGFESTDLLAASLSGRWDAQVRHRRAPTAGRFIGTSAPIYRRPATIDTLGDGTPKKNKKRTTETTETRGK